MTKEEYKEKKLEQYEKEFFSLAQLVSENGWIGTSEKLQAFLSQTIDELGKLPDEQSVSEKEKGLGKYMARDAENFYRGWNACIAEAERMRDLSIKTKE